MYVSSPLSSLRTIHWHQIMNSLEPITQTHHTAVPSHPRNVIDDFNREGLGIEVDFSLPSERVIRSLDRIIEWRGKPNAIRCDNGPEYISAVTLAWAAKRGIRIDFIQPGQPQQNAYVERYNRTVRYDWLAHHLFETLDEIQEFATRWLWTYNYDRPNMALGGITPKQKLALAA